MGNPAIFAGTRTKLLTQKGLLLKSGAVIDHDGPKNYLATGNFENGLTTGWNSFSTTLTNKIPTGTITTPSAKFTPGIVTSNPLAGTRSLQIACDNSTAGHGLISDAFTIDREDVGKVLETNFAYEIVSGSANMTLATDTTATLGVFLYDVTGASWITPAGFTPIIGTLPDRARGVTFQTSGDTTHTQYRLAIIVMNSPASTGFTINFDRFFLGPQLKSYGAAIGELGTETWTDNWSNATFSMKISRIGNRVFVEGLGTITGATTASQLQLTVPAAYSADTTSHPIASASMDNTVGHANILDSGTSQFSGLAILTGANTLELHTINAGSTYAFKGPATSTVPITWANGDKIWFKADWVVQGWAASSLLSDAADTRTVAFSSAGTPTASLLNGSFVNVTFPSSGGASHVDTHGKFSGGFYTIPVTGYYDLEFQMQITGSFASYGGGSFGFKFNNSSVSYYQWTQVAGANGVCSGTCTRKGVYLTVGTTIIPVVSTGGWSSVSVNSDNSTHVFSVTRVQGPNQIAASELIAARYTTVAGQSTTSAAADAIIDYGTKDYDTHNCVTTGASWKFTAPRAGFYEVMALAWFQGATGWAATEYGQIKLYKNGSYFSYLDYKDDFSSASSIVKTLDGKDVIYLLPGEYIDIRIAQNSGGTLTMSTSAGINRVTVTSKT